MASSSRDQPRCCPVGRGLPGDRFEGAARRRSGHRRHQAPGPRRGAGTGVCTQRARPRLVDPRDPTCRTRRRARERPVPGALGPIHDELLDHDYRMVLLAERGDGALAERLLDRSVDGAVLMTTRLTSSLPSQLAARDLPFVFLNRIGGVVDAPSVTADNVGGARSAAELLIGLGHERIAAVVGPEDTSTARDREAGFRSALADAGIALPSTASLPSGLRPRERPRRTGCPPRCGRSSDGDLLCQ